MRKVSEKQLIDSLKSSRHSLSTREEAVNRLKKIESIRREENKVLSYILITALTYISIFFYYKPIPSPPVQSKSVQIKNPDTSLKILPITESFQEMIDVNGDGLIVPFDPDVCADYNGDGCDDCNSSSIACTNEYSLTPQFGGLGGQQFSFILPECAKFSSIQVSIGDRIDRITMGYKLKNGEEQNISYGGNGGYLSPVFFFPAPLVRITGRSSDKVDQLQFHFADGTSSPVYGGNSGTPFSIQLKEEELMGGILGRNGSEIDAIGFYLKHER